MPAVILGLLSQENISMKEVSEKSHVPLSTLANAAKKPIETWSIRVLNAFAKGLNKRSSELLDLLQPAGYTLEIDDKKQTIQGVYIPDPAMYHNIRTAVEVEHLEGWNPTRKDIKYLLDSAINPDPKLTQRYDKIFGETDD